jgi:MFS family permease
MNGWPALRHRMFVSLWVGGVVSAVGTQMSNVAKAWVLYQLTGSATALGIEGLCFSVPMMILPLLTGPIADRLDRTALCRWTMVGEAVMAGGLAVAAGTGLLTPGLLYVTAALEATRLAIDIPARSALTVTVVPPADLHSAQSLTATVFSASGLIGPAIGGAILAVGNPAWVFTVNAVSCVIALVMFRGMPPSGREHRAPARLADGLRYAFRYRIALRLLAVLLTTGSLAIGVETLLPILATDRWHCGSAGYGLLRVAPGVAAVVAGLVLGRSHAPRSPARAIATCVAVAAGAFGAVSISPGLAGAFALLAIGSFAVSAAQVHTLTRLQQITTDDVRGAISGMTAITMSGFAGVAAAAMAFAAGGAGPAPVIAVVAALAALTGLIPRSSPPSPPLPRGSGKDLPPPVPSADRNSRRPHTRRAAYLDTRHAEEAP